MATVAARARRSQSVTPSQVSRSAARASSTSCTRSARWLVSSILGGGAGFCIAGRSPRSSWLIPVSRSMALAYSLRLALPRIASVPIPAFTLIARRVSSSSGPAGALHSIA